jgi:hypothetical protein
MRWLKRVSVVATVGASLIAIAQPALASDHFGPYKGVVYGPCVKVYANPNGKGVSPYLHYADDFTAESSKVTVGTENTYADAGLTCGLSGGGYEVKAYKITLVNTWVLGGSSLSGCSLGYPSGFTCSSSSKTVRYTYTNTCKKNVQRCTHDFQGITFLAGSGGKFDSLVHTTTATYSNKSGDQYTYSTGGDTTFQW